MQNENTDPEIIEEEDNTPKNSIMESIKFVVDMMNSGKVNPKDVYPGGSNRYHGD